MPQTQSQQAQIELSPARGTFGMQMTPTGYTMTYTSNEKGNFAVTENIDKHGNGTISTPDRDLKFSMTDQANRIQGHQFFDVGGNSCTMVSGLNEAVVSSKSLIISSTGAAIERSNEMANKAQNKLVAARALPDEAPDTSAMGAMTSAVTKALKPPDHILKNLISPSAKDLAKTAESTKKGGSLFSSIYVDIVKYFSMWGKVLSSVSLKSLKEAAKIQVKYPIEKAKEAAKEKAKMYKKLNPAQKKALKDGVGKEMFDEKKGLSLENGEEILQKVTQVISNPLSLLGLFFDFSSSNKDLPKKKMFDQKKYQDVAKECLDEAMKAEKKNC